MIGVTAIARRLAYRHPMLLIDRVTEVAPGDYLNAIKAVTASEPWFRECLPASLDTSVAPTPAVFPAVFLIESLCQAAGVLAAWDDPRPSVLSGDAMLLGSLSDVTFHASVEPGSVLHHRVRLVRSFGDALIFEGESSVDGHLVLRVGRILMAIRPAATVTGIASAPDGARHPARRNTS
jgi:3-hydroxyacyl-[acyl-carrier-protein] dehydratase